MPGKMTSKKLTSKTNQSGNATTFPDHFLLCKLARTECLSDPSQKKEKRGQE